ncbi:MAG: hypothetical protein JNL43_09690 [Flavobacteriales bacterium]|nr:hypothetical protein [Flavobacteriales bacterium]HRH68293.1 hypothetical protein [Flavobacteriales bacterium]
MRHMLSLVAPFVLLCATSTVQAQDVLVLPINGRVSDGERKLEGCDILTYKGNDLVGKQTTTGNGRFGMVLGLGEEFAIEFRKEGYLPKRVLVDTRGDLPKDLVDIAPIEMAMSMLPSSKYEGADTDVLDFPFAIVRYDRGARAFIQDQQYTVDMMRTNGALLLMSGRSGKD